MKVSRPVYLNLWRIKFPITAIVSILHRVSGVVIFFGLPLLLYLLKRSLQSQEKFDHLIMQLQAAPGMRLIIWLLLCAVAWHTVAGIRHLLMDGGYAESLRGGRISAYIAIVIVAIIAILLGIWIW